MALTAKRRTERAAGHGPLGGFLGARPAARHARKRASVPAPRRRAGPQRARGWHALGCFELRAAWGWTWRTPRQGVSGVTRRLSSAGRPRLSRRVNRGRPRPDPGTRGSEDLPGRAVDGQAPRVALREGSAAAASAGLEPGMHVLQPLGPGRGESRGVAAAWLRVERAARPHLRGLTCTATEQWAQPAPDRGVLGYS